MRAQTPQRQQKRHPVPKARTVAMMVALVALLHSPAKPDGWGPPGMEAQQELVEPGLYMGGGTVVPGSSGGDVVDIHFWWDLSPFFASGQSFFDRVNEYEKDRRRREREIREMLRELHRELEEEAKRRLEEEWEKIEEEMYELYVAAEQERMGPPPWVGLALIAAAAEETPRSAADRGDPDVQTQTVETGDDESWIEDLADVTFYADAAPSGPNLVAAAAAPWAATVERILSPIVPVGVSLPSATSWSGGFASLGARSSSAARPSSRSFQSFPSPQTGAPPDARLRMYLTSLGVATGEAFQLHLVADEGFPLPMPTHLIARGLVVEPVPGDVQRQLQRELQQLAGKKVVTAKISAYCVEYLRLPPPAGMMFRVAVPQLQRRFEPMDRILQASRRLQEAGLLPPDSEPTSYFHSIRQWAMWAAEQNFTREAFREAFLDFTKGGFERSGQPWTRAVEEVIRGAVPGRWRAIEHILREAGIG